MLCRVAVSLVLGTMFVTAPLCASAQKHATHTPPHPIQPAKVSNEAATEPHHKLVFQNAKTRIFRVDLPPGASTEIHTHTRDYIVIALTKVSARNEFDTSKSKSDSTVMTMGPGEMQVVKVPQTAKLVNQANAPMSWLEVEIPAGFHPDLIVCGLGKRGCPSDVGDLSDPAHQFSLNFLFETDAVRVRDITIGPGAILLERDSKDDFARIAITPLDLTLGDGQSAKLNVGDVQWVTAGDIPKIVNNSKDEARFYEIEFK
jgi:hypothetical protein